ncbi:hypothetical protein C7450_103121 [Chelatococcus asaccharovorans]|uniref:Uncharacterized protein n=1 Tax=Chelatococcus asaccharovorans TaxID=28210 RepID=A0A2V3UAQ5_9HYPH|nr:hypothetical protein C7450_103121 [Chelatococcus asaccharovorans]
MTITQSHQIDRAIWLGLGHERDAIDKLSRTPLHYG